MVTKSLVTLAIALVYMLGITERCDARQKKPACDIGGFSVSQFKAKGDGKHDDTEAFQTGLNTVFKSGGGILNVPAGKYRIASHLEIPSGVALQGVWAAPHHSKLPVEVTGSLLLAEEGQGTEDGAPFILLNENSAVRGVTIYYPNQIPENITPYPWTFRGKDMHCTIENVTLVNSFNGIDFATEWNELHYVRNVYGVCLRRGISIDKCTDIGRIENVHFNPHYWARAPFPNVPSGDKWPLVLNYMVANAEGFIFARSDWEYVLNTFCFGYKIGYRFIQSKDGCMNGNILGIGADGGNVAVQVDAAAPYGILITNGEFVSMFGDHPVQILTKPEFKGVLQLSNCAFWGPTYACAELKGPGSVSFSQCNFVHWNKESPAIRADAGTVSFSNCKFYQPQAHISLGEAVRGAIIMGNMFNGPIMVDNKSKGKVEMGLNVDGVE